MVVKGRIASNFFFTTLTVFIALLIGPGAHAKEFDIADLWLSLDVGLASNLIQEDYQQSADDKGLDITIGDPQTARLSWKVGLGWDFWETSDEQLVLSSQLEWINLGNVNLDYSGEVANDAELQEIYDGLADIHPNSGNGIGVGFNSRWKGTGDLNLDPFEFGSELGLFFWWQDYELDGVNESAVRTDSISGIGWYGGLHFDYQIDPRWSARAGTRLYGIGDELVQSTRVGLTYRFGAKPAEPTVIEVEVPAGPSLDDRYVLSRSSSQPLNVLLNDTSVGNNLRVARVSQAESGDVSISSDQRRIRYRHNGDDAEVDQFEYWIDNGDEEVGPVQVMIEIVAAPPNANGDSFQVGFNTSSRLDVLENDSDPQGRPLTIVEYSIPDYGSLSMLDNVLIYDHYGDNHTEVSFFYWVSNGDNEAGPIRVDLIILPEIFTIPVKFDPSSTVIRTEDKPALNRLSVWMTDNPGTRVSILGHTDDTGIPAANQLLSLGRAQSVMNYLATQGIDPNRLSAEGFGDSRPVATNVTPQGRLQNRRVEFRLF
ncbi:hypothetical protein BGP77_17505 [Saccharospirillum sp. MSK14-1]|uniref:OmpA family protein n=1 Tax=Saccharospirillum sp. MSK14-1 TaxID=1897632 RepID=UPI000D4976D2|nr:OmpA family protein [Saccharospirillum sp. MSK14-1]PTY38237.1 hypothetical protein BGP77_17505 [Saccharospirillum sp. MSK14-1]